MINIDSLGLAPPQVFDHASSKELRELAAELAKEMKIGFGYASVGGADVDSSSFLKKKIPRLLV